MSMDMEEANPPEKFHGFRNMEELVVSAALQKMNPEVAVDIIKMANSLTLLTSAKSLCEGIVHIHVSGKWT